MIRRATNDDREAILGLMIKFEEEKENDQVGQVLKRNLKRIIQNYISGDEHMFLIAEDAGRIVGYLFGHTEKKYLQDTKYDPAKLVEIYVKPSERRKQFGRILYDQFVQWCQRQDIHKIYLDVESCDVDAISFWTKIGFKEVWKGMEKRI